MQLSFPAVFPASCLFPEPCGQFFCSRRLRRTYSSISVIDSAFVSGYDFNKNSFGRRYYLAGYSLAGLFALWSLYEADCFDGAVCCSGSLWLDGWDRYVLEHSIQAPADVYLSLGGREEKTRNPMMALVGDRTRAQEKILKKDPLVRHCTLEWNPGGHFADSAQRLAKGIRWICAQSLSPCQR